MQYLGCGKLSKLNRFTGCQSPSAILLGGGYPTSLDDGKVTSIRSRLVGSAKLADGLFNYKNNPIHICNRHDFCQYQ